MASIFLHHVIGDLTVGKPEIAEFYETETVNSAISILGESAEGSIPVWRRPQACASAESVEMRQQRFLGILNSFDVVAFLARKYCLSDQERALACPVSEVVFADNSLLREVDPGTRLLDAMEIMKQGVRRLLVPSGVWRGTSKHFSILFNGRWLRNLDTCNGVGGGTTVTVIDRPSSNLSVPKPLHKLSVISGRKKFCCLSREDVLRFLIGCLGALAPIPLTSIHTLGSINCDYRSLEASSPALDAIQDRPQDPCAVAVVERVMGGSEGRIIGEISSSRLWKLDHMAAAWALATLSARQFVTGEDEAEPGPPPLGLSSNPGGGSGCGNGRRSTRARRFNSRSIGFFGNVTGPGPGAEWGAYRGRSEPLMCRSDTTLAAVMAQMLSHRATHLWVTESEKDDIVVGVVGYADILAAVMCSCYTPPLPPSSLVHKADHPTIEEDHH